jgi:hypothetical protein
MKKTLRAVGAAGLAAATIVTGLSFGAAASAASTDENYDEIQLAFRSADGTGAIWAPSTEHLGGSGSSQGYPVQHTFTDQLSSASQARTYKVSEVEVDGNIYLQLKTGSSSCLVQRDYHGIFLSIGACSTNPRALFLFKDGTLADVDGRTFGRRGGSGQWTVGTKWHEAWGLTYGSGLEVVGDTSALEPRRHLAPRIGSVDVENGTAEVTGTVWSGATDIEITWKTESGATRIRNVKPDHGEFSYPLTELAIGSTSVELTSYEDGEELGAAKLEAKLEVAPVTAQAEFPSDVMETVQLSGTAQPNAPIEFRHAEKVIGGATTNAAGDWTGTVNAPNAAGPYNIDVVQRVRGEDAGRTPLDIDYGTGVAVTSPGQGAVVDPADPELIIRGTAPAGTTVKVYEKGQAATQLAEPKTSGSNNTFRLITVPLEDREYTLVVEGITKGYNRTHSELRVNPGKSTIAAPGGKAVFDADVSKKATIAGTGAAGATITVKNGSTKLGSTTVGADGKWSLPIAPIGPGKHTLTLEQAGIEGTQTATTEIDYGRGVAFSTEDGVSFADGKLTVAGTSVQGAQVTIVTGGKQVDSFTVTNADGTFTRELQGVGAGNISLTATAHSRGDLTTTDTLTASSPVAPSNLAVASHVKGGTFVPGPQTFTGSATPGATVQMNPFGFTNPNFASYTLTTTADQFGSWTINRGLSDTPYPNISFKQTPHNGVVNELPNYDLKPYKEIGQPGDLTLTNFTAGDYFNPGDQIFTGTATPGATVTLNPFGFDPKYAAYDITTTADTTTGTWQIRRGLADVLYAKLAVKQDPEADGKVNRIEDITVAGNGWTNGTPADLVLTSTDTTFTPGVVTFTGTATPGKTITMFPFGDGQYAHIKDTVKANAIGKWEIKRTLSNQPYPAVFTQDTQNGKVNRITHTITPTK